MKTSRIHSHCILHAVLGATWLLGITGTVHAESVPPALDRLFCRALPGYRFEFPRDHFSHPCFRTEWWYFTGNVAAQEGRQFGFELTFFREGINNPYANPSRWRLDDLYLAHFAISDLNRKKFFYTQRLNRAGIALAGASQSEGRIWNGAWFAKPDGDQWELYAAEDGHRIHLKLQSLKPPAIHGRDGVSQKAAGEGNASHYYSLTRLETSGQIEAEGTTYEVSGLSWMDREFFTNHLQPEQVGWDWASLQLEDGTELMLYQLRLRDGGHDPHSSGSFVDREGRVTHLAAEDFQMTPQSRWQSPHTSARYPIRWRIRAPRLALEVEIEAAIRDQELVTQETTGVIYWEGSITAKGARNKRPVAGRGYLEMTGYAGPLPAGFYSSE